MRNARYRTVGQMLPAAIPFPHFLLLTFHFLLLWGGVFVQHLQECRGDIVPAVADDALGIH